ncbi:ExbD/TolR family protein [Paraburkholderia megapolitana]|jgi:biopolymer transport protein ExbD|uniref:Outer membrane transport energization protein ExbD n=1 Tax=Paraburkholderia megapolitana TaxID=420953 RepID=A0A1I3VRZ1_9BURK|nr:biopolymer transporter ExbD [Paraburkholderia megapolitana]QDQ84649.1 biopolymer transporter ExbD [Paraburkholderia megapolitana]SFJ98005.1 outer membrane transport energization protein ExbD [Paraburkholderia megapolitana]
MGMNVSSGGRNAEPEVMVDINTTPLIDVMLVLLIMLIITIPIQMHSIKMNLPIGNPPPPLVQPEVVQIDIDFDGTTTWNGVLVPDRAALEAKLSQVAAEPVQAEIHLRPNKLVPYKDVAAVMASAQRLGATKIGLIGNEQYMQ